MDKQSFLGCYPVEVVHNTIDTSIFKPRPSDFRKHGHAYAVEVKISYRPELRRQYFDQLRKFTQAIAEQSRKNLTFVFCLLTDVPVEEIRRQFGDIDQIVGCDVVIRTFTIAEVEGTKKPTET